MSIKENIKKEEKPLKDNKKEDDMAKKKKHEVANLISLIIGIILILSGLGGVAIAIAISSKSLIIILSSISLLIGAILALVGGLRGW